GAPGFGAGAVNDEQRDSSAVGIFGGELSCNFGISEAEVGVVGIYYFEIVFRLVGEWISAAGYDDDVFDAVAVQISFQGRGCGDQGAGVAKLFLYEVVVNAGRRSGFRGCGLLGCRGSRDE